MIDYLKEKFPKVQIDNTQKLFYKKYPFRLKLKISRLGSLNTTSWFDVSLVDMLLESPELATNEKLLKFLKSHKKITSKDKFLDFFDFVDFKSLMLEEGLDVKYFVGYSNNTSSVFFENYDLMVMFAGVFSDYLESITCIHNDNQLQLLKDQHQIIIRPKLWYGKFLYKMKFESLSQDEKSIIVNVLNNYNDNEYLFRPRTWALSTVYVTDRSLAIHLQMLVGEKVQRFEKCVLLSETQGDFMYA